MEWDITTTQQHDEITCYHSTDYPNCETAAINFWTSAASSAETLTLTAVNDENVSATLDTNFTLPSTS